MDAIEAAVGKTDAAVAAYSQALLADQAARAREIEARQDWRRVYQKLYAEVLVAMNGLRTDAESFFRSAPSAGSEPDAPVPVA